MSRLYRLGEMLRKVCRDRQNLQDVMVEKLSLGDEQLLARAGLYRRGCRGVHDRMMCKGNEVKQMSLQRRSRSL